MWTQDQTPALTLMGCVTLGKLSERTHCPRVSSPWVRSPITLSPRPPLQPSSLSALHPLAEAAWAWGHRDPGSFLALPPAGWVA